MSYFEELWSAGKEQDNSEDLNTNHEQFKQTSLPKASEIGDEIFFSPTNLPEFPKQQFVKDNPKNIEELFVAPKDEFSDMDLGSSLKVLGIGGAGCNAINRMIEDQVAGVDFIAINTDVQVLKKSFAKKRIAIGNKITKGLGAGAKPEIGEKSAIESVEEIRTSLKNTDMVFITAGMGGGTGTGATPVVAQVAKEIGCLVVAVVTLPFSFEGSKRQKTALEGIDKLKDHVDTMLVISNSRIFEIVEKNTSVKDAFKKIDEVLKQAVQGIAGIISETAIINVDFNDIKTILANRGEAIMGIGQAKGDGRALKAAEEALANPLIENNTFRQAGAMVAKIVGGTDFDMKEFYEAAQAISTFCREDAEIIMGLDFDESLHDQVRIIIVATDLIRDTQPQKQQPLEQQIPNPQQHYVPQSQQPIRQEKEYQMFTQQDIEKRLHQQETNYLDHDDDWGLRFNKPKNNFSNNENFEDRRSIDFSVRKEDTRVYEDIDPNLTRRTISAAPNIASDLDTPAFLRRRKRILSNNN
ncbi:MAG: cell division protein FtsZ [Brevinema sp.]